jgi:cytolysin (calcineurin-like family phosphatase)
MAAVEKLGGRPTSAEAEAASMPTRIFARAGMLADGGSSAWAPSAAWEKATRQRVAAQAGAGAGAAAMQEERRGASVTFFMQGASVVGWGCG